MTKLAASLQPEKLEFLYRSYIALGQYSLVMSEISENFNTSVGLRAIRYLASYLNDPKTLEIVIGKLKDLQTGSFVNDKVFYIVGALLNTSNDNLKEALRYTNGSSNIEA